MSVQRLLALLVALTFSAAHARNDTPQDVAFVNAQGIRITGKLFRTSWSGARPVVVMLHGCSGIYSNSEPANGVARLYTEWASRLTTNGHHALLVDSFTARGVAQNQCGNGSSGVSEVSDRPTDAYAARRWLNERADVDGLRIALLGWSHGASSVIAAMANTAQERSSLPFKAAFAFYPGCGLYNAFGGIATSTYVPYAPVLVLHGSADPLYQSQHCQARIANATALGANSANGNPMEMIVYGDAKHSFDMARSSDASWTPYDLNAKMSADAETLSRLANLLR